MVRILSHAQTSSAFFKYLQAFGQKSYARDEGFSGSDVTITRDENGAIDVIGKILTLAIIF